MFIRTKDGRIINYDENANKIDLPMILNYPNQILNQSDNLAELCDEFHIEYDSLIFPREINYVKYYDFEIAKDNLEDGDTLYGVIHIKGKGLIYVAKMNSEGNLELL